MTINRHQVLNCLENILENINLEEFNNSGLVGGKAGAMILFATSYKLLGKNIYRTNYEMLIDYLINDLEDSNMSDTMADGFTGVLWSFTYIKKIGLINFEEEFDTIAEIVVSSFEKDIRIKNFDLLHGLIGKAIFFLDNYPSYNSEKVIGKVLSILQEIAEYEDEFKILWLDTERNINGEKAVNLSLSHGLSSIILFLCKTHHIVNNKDVVYILLEKAVNTLLTFKSKINGYPRFPDMIINNESINDEKSRLAWCYGELGRFIALKESSLILNNNREISTIADELLEYIIEFMIKNDGIYKDDQFGIDIGFCHGASGVAHIFKRMANKYHKKELHKVSDYFLELTLEQLIKGITTTKFPIFHQNKDKFEWISNHSLLGGLSGVGMVLLTFLYPEETKHWDSIFLTDIA